ncbi:hypothetical protein Pcinc_035004 [Petrolisthes cinctipes]|uniref:Uncharacterized protein n=1 Tax=Petrolisthes cinctipes TaxID=88211 RepID=A0AAE1C0M9_PETCI|nr:hypothetical protein Pcinc_035004 [Petrolisthes cinctipes]
MFFAGVYFCFVRSCAWQESVRRQRREVPGWCLLCNCPAWESSNSTASLHTNHLILLYIIQSFTERPSSVIIYDKNTRMRVGEGRSNSRWPEPCKRTKQAGRQAGRGISWQVGWLAGWLAGGRKEDSGRAGYRGRDTHRRAPPQVGVEKKSVMSRPLVEEAVRPEEGSVGEAGGGGGRLRGGWQACRDDNREGPRRGNGELWEEGWERGRC